MLQSFATIDLAHLKQKWLNTQRKKSLIHFNLSLVLIIRKHQNLSNKFEIGKTHPIFIPFSSHQPTSKYYESLDEQNNGDYLNCVRKKDIMEPNILQIELYCSGKYDLYIGEMLGQVQTTPWDLFKKMILDTVFLFSSINFKTFLYYVEQKITIYQREFEIKLIQKVNDYVHRINKQQILGSMRKFIKNIILVPKNKNNNITNKQKIE
ncbi:unnamed protein product [Paramecium octaurelia]|uniref:Uncharacterized protein n=1 Tax=Paramecium octaurelia TaxID=43137 RepID=A0A8S1YSP8_PAROT|nr:unnamed protein product [Paramecium octaurelia]